MALPSLVLTQIGSVFGSFHVTLRHLRCFSRAIPCTFRTTLKTVSYTQYICNLIRKASGVSCESTMSESCKSCFPDSNNNCYGGQRSPGKGGFTGATPPMPPRKVQVTAKILFGSVSAITTMKNQEKAAKKKSQ